VRPPRSLPGPQHDEVSGALDEEYAELADMLERYPVNSTLNLCRLVYSVETNDVVVLKVAASDWALMRLPDE
jgi:hypothetical protein